MLRTRRPHWIASPCNAVVARHTRETLIIVLIENRRTSCACVTCYTVSCYLACCVGIVGASWTSNGSIEASHIAVGTDRTVHTGICILFMKRVVLPLRTGSNSTSCTVRASWTLVLEATFAFAKDKFEGLTIHQDRLCKFATQVLRIVHLDKEQVLLEGSRWDQWIYSRSPLDTRSE